MALWRALLPLLVYASQSALGQSEVDAVVGAPSVFLPCLTRPLVSVPSARWARGSEEVLFRISRGDDIRKQSPLFKGRVQMRPDALQSGNVTLELKNPTLSDSGTYTCLAREGITDVKLFTVELTVKEPPPSPPPSPVPIIPIVVGTQVGIVVLLASVVSVLSLKRSKETNESFKDALLGVVTCRKATSML